MNKTVHGISSEMHLHLFTDIPVNEVINSYSLHNPKFLWSTKLWSTSEKHISDNE